MGRLRPFVLTFVPSILIGGFIQQTLMLGVLHANEPNPRSYRSPFLSC
jgi:hypothetical protein